MNIRVRVNAGAKRESVIELSQKQLAISVCEKALENQANNRVITLVARHFGVAEPRVRLIRGHHSPNKSFEIAD